jgi:hypothetical protein
MSKFKKTFTLKQHTPLIHFQADQSGATLRASELKPKFDKFLKKYAFGGNVPDEYKIDKDKDALKYKVKIEFIEVDVQDIKNKSYFGNMGKKPNDKDFRRATIAEKSFKIEFNSFEENLLKIIEEYFASFLAITNFGTRQSKGFGSFYLDKSDNNYIDIFQALDKIDAKYIYANYNKPTEEIFSYVEVIYPLIKTGINYPDYPKKTITSKDGKTKQVPDPEAGRGKKASYYKSYLFQYMLEKNPPIGNEKRFIKENFFRRDVRIQSDNVTKKYVRALLGICDGVEFKDHERRGKIEYKNNQIDRFKSPLTFKIVDNHLIIIANEINNNIFNQEFTFENKVRDKTFSQTILTPNSNEFNLSDFLYSFAEYFNNEIKLKEDNKKKNIFDKKIEEAKRTNFLRHQNAN